jgi:hypothetical protein
MIRRFNYTGRKKLNRSDFNLTLTEMLNSTTTFDAELRLQELGLPDTAGVYIEAYHRAFYKRFYFGKVSRIEPPADRVLEGVKGADGIHFRIKIVDESGKHGRLVASADRISPLSKEQSDADKVSLLHVVYEDLRDEIWKLELDGDWPALVVNKRIEGITEIVRADPQFFSLVYPTVVRQILTEIILNQSYYSDSVDDDWQSLWLQFVEGLPGMMPHPQPSDTEADRTRIVDWIDDAVSSFCSSNRVREAFVQIRSEVER